MTDRPLDPQLQALFAQSEENLPADQFTTQVMQGARKVRVRAIARRALFAVLLAGLAMPLQDFALEFAHVLIVSLVQIENDLVAQLLAPINSVGGALSLTLLLIRAGHKKLFT
jgi:hypothetical protein